MHNKIVGIEPGSNLVAIAKEKTKDYPNVEIVEAMFEDFESSEKFDCLIALTSFHWISEQAKYKKAYDLLNRNGHFVIVWNSFFQSASDATKEVNSLYHEMLPDIYPEQNDDVNLGVFCKLNGRELEIVGSDMFYLYFLRKYVTVYNYDKETYPMLLNTFPKIIKVEKERREKFLKRVGEIVEKHGTLSVPVLTTLLITKKKDVFLDEIGKA
ncbi:MAG: class I SAM-dependent methyltransferase [Patescibacteria group bacterium]|nr:class I SAM-dependent methyltransferase [Patescibacteria group bacterium]